jgi:hypothetical protein
MWMMKAKAPNANFVLGFLSFEDYLLSTQISMSDVTKFSTPLSMATAKPLMCCWRWSMTNSEEWRRAD